MHSLFDSHQIYDWSRNILSPDNDSDHPASGLLILLMNDKQRFKGKPNAFAINGRS